MKKLLGASLALTMSVACAFGIAGCKKSNSGANDADIAERAIAQLKTQYDKTDLKNTDKGFAVFGKVSVDNKLYDVDWTVSNKNAEDNDINDYITFSDDLNDDYEYTVTVDRPVEDIEYYLNATVTVGKKNTTASYSFERVLLGTGKIYTVAEIMAFNDTDHQFIEVKSTASANGMYYSADGINATAVTVKGYVVDPGVWSDSYKNFTGVWIVDNYTGAEDKSSEGAMQVYRVAADDVYIKDAFSLVKGDLITITGYVQNYKDTIQISNTYNDKVYCISRVREEISDEAKVAEAKEAFDLATKNYTALGTVDLPTATGREVAISWSVSGETDLVSISDNKLTIAKLPETATEVTLIATFKKGEATDTKSIKITVSKPVDIGLEHAGTEADPYSLADVKKIFATLEKGKTLQENGQDKQVYIKGYVTDIGSLNGSYGLQKVYIADAIGTAKADSVLVYNINWGGALEQGAGGKNPLNLGDEVVVYGFIMNHSSGGYEIGQSGSGSDATYPTVTKWTPHVMTPAEKVQAALNAVSDTMTITVAGDTDLDVSSIEGVTLTWELTSGDAATLNDTKTKLQVAALPAETATVTLKVTATLDSDASVKVEKTVTVTIKSESALTPSHAGNEADPFTVEDALLIIDNLESGGYYKDDAGVNKKVYVKGYVVGAPETRNDGKGIYRVYISDTKGDTTNQIMVYYTVWNTVVPDADHMPEVGDVIVACAWLCNYQGKTPEITGSSSDPAVISDWIRDDKNVIAESLAELEEAIEDIDGKLLTDVDAFVTLPTVSNSNVTLNWAVTNGTAALVKFEDGKVIVVSLPEDANATLTITGTLTIGEEEETASFTIEIQSAQGDTRTPEAKIEAALNAIENDFENAVLENASAIIELPTTSDHAVDVTLEWEVMDHNDLVEIEAGKLTVKQLPAADTVVTIKVTAKIGDDKSDSTNVYVTVKADPALKYGTAEAPLSVAQALEIVDVQCAALSSWTLDAIYMKGIAVNTAVKSSKGNYYDSFTIKDETDPSKSILVYSINLQSGVEPPAQNDIVIISGYVTRYGTSGTGTIEFSRKTDVTPVREVLLESNTRGESTITLGAHDGATVNDLPATGTNGSEVTFTVTADANKEIVNVKANGVMLNEASGSYKFTVIGNTTVTVETKDVGAADPEQIAFFTFANVSGKATVSTTVSSYTSTFNATAGGVTWKIDNFNNQNTYADSSAWYHIRTGHKSNDMSDVSKAGKITTQAAMSADITKVVLSLSFAQAADASKATIVLEASESSDFSSTVAKIEKSGSDATGTELEFDLGANHGTNLYYRLTFKCTAGSANGYLHLVSVSYEGFNA